MVGTAIRTRSVCQCLVRRPEPEACDNGWYGDQNQKLVTMVGPATRIRSLCQWLVRRPEPEACANGWYGDQNQKLVTMVGTASTKLVPMVVRR